jgi:dolichyl-phosphate-mannose-protein mannosyltransferase
VIRKRRLLDLREAALVVLAFLVMPAAIYTLSYVPWMRQGHSLEDMLRLQRDIWTYHATLDAKHPYFSRWWTWPFLYRPAWYYFKYENSWTRGIIALGNPALWWATVPVTAWALVTGIRERDPRRIFSGAGFCLLYLPWGISPRTLNYSHYLFEAIPYACLTLGGLLDRHWRSEIARAYLIVVVALFFLFLPLYMAIPIPSAWWRWRLPGNLGVWTWFPTWV